MNISINGIKTAATQFGGRGLLLTQKYSPEILTVAGVAGVVVGTVMAAKATMKLEETVEKMDERKSVIHERQVTLTSEAYSSTAAKRDMTGAYFHNTVDLVKLYGPSATTIATSLFCLVAANGILRKRNVALVAAYKAVEGSFSEYRKRVVDEFGEEKDLEYVRGMRTEAVTGEDGKTVAKTTLDPTEFSPYARVFDENNDNWKKVPEYNLMFLRAQQNFANDMLKTKGHLFLNEVYDMIGVPRSQAGQMVGWAITKEQTGDHFIDFNLYDMGSDKARDFINGYEAAVWLDFNVDGVIFDLI